MVKRWWSRATPSDFSNGSVMLAPHERVLVAVEAADGTWTVGTDRALHLGAVVLGWHQIDRARWLEGDVLEVVTLPGDTASTRTHRVSIPEPGLLPELIRERVTSSILVSERVTLLGQVSARIVARRAAGDGDVQWSVLYDDAALRPDARLAEAARVAVTSLRGQWGV